MKVPNPGYRRTRLPRLPHGISKTSRLRNLAEERDNLDNERWKTILDEVLHTDYMRLYIKDNLRFWLPPTAPSYRELLEAAISDFINMKFETEIPDEVPSLVEWLRDQMLDAIQDQLSDSNQMSKFIRYNEPYFQFFIYAEDILLLIHAKLCSLLDQWDDEQIQIYITLMAI